MFIGGWLLVVVYDCVGLLVLNAGAFAILLYFGLWFCVCLIYFVETCLCLIVCFCFCYFCLFYCWVVRLLCAVMLDLLDFVCLNVLGCLRLLYCLLLVFIYISV